MYENRMGRESVDMMVTVGQNGIKLNKPKQNKAGR